jgi:diacylglycerol kinase family enzyme
MVVPAGTLNHFALEIGVESVDDAVTALRTGSAARVDLGRVADQVFVNTCSTGLYADLVRFRRRWEPRVGKWPAVVIGLVHALRRSHPHEMTVDGEPRRLWLLFAGNGNYRPKGFAPTYRPSLDDGSLDVRMMDGAARFARTRIVLAVLTRTLRWSRVYDARSATEVRVSLPEDQVRISVDGEVKLVPGDFEIRVDRRGLLVYRPGEVPG